MKKLLIGSMVLLFAQHAYGQTWSEWFQQKKTQKQYLLQQISALKVFSGYLSEGHNIAKNGLGIIQDLKNGDFNLHSDYFHSLTSVNPAIQRYVNVGAIISIQANIMRLIAKATPAFVHSQQFTSIEINYIKKVFESLLTDCMTNINTLYNLITSSSLKMKDDERLCAIDSLRGDMQDKQTFIHSFCTSTTRLLAQRSHRADEIIIAKKLNRLK